MADLINRRRIPAAHPVTILLGGIFAILLTAALRFGAGLLLPVAIAMLFTLLLDPVVRSLRRFKMSQGLAAAIVVFGTLGILSTGIGLLAGPAAEWIEDAPTTLTKVQTKIRRLLRPIQETAQKVEQATDATGNKGGPPTVKIQTQGLLQRVTGSTANAVGTALTVIFLTYFLLACLPMLKQKAADLIRGKTSEKDVERLLTEIETQMSRYLLINTLTSLGVGLATFGLLAAVGMPNAMLWGVVAFLLNYVPYVGFVVTIVVIGAAALVSFDDTSRVLIIIGGFAAINLLEGNLITPHLLGEHLPLNPVAIFVGLLYWGWVWGPIGTLLAVPLTVMLQVVASRVKGLEPLAVMLDS